MAKAKFVQRIKRYGNSYMILVPSNVIKNELAVKERDLVNVEIDGLNENLTRNLATIA